MSRSQPRRLPFHIVEHGCERDVVAHIADEQVSLAELCEVAGLSHEGVCVDGQLVHDPSAVSAVTIVTAGSTVGSQGAVPYHDMAAVGRAGTRSESQNTPVVLQFGEVAGLDSGSVVDLPAGDYRLDTFDPSKDSQWCVIVNQEATIPVSPAPWHDRASTIEVVTIDGRVFAFNSPIDAEAGSAGNVRRPPRPVSTRGVDPIHLVAPPRPPKEPQPFSWATFLTPIPIGIVMALFFSPVFALFAVIGPVIAGGRWIEGKRRHKRETRERSQQVAAIAAGFERNVAAYLEELVQHRWLHSPHVPQLLERARMHSVRLWERRPGSDGYLKLVVGVGPDLVALDIDGSSTPDALAHASATERHLVRSVPHVVDLEANAGVGLWGESDETAAVARCLLMQLVTLHGPADVSIGVVCADDRRCEWDFVKWLPHTHRSLVSSSIGVVAAGLASQRSQVSGNHRFSSSSSQLAGGTPMHLGEVFVVIVDDPAADVAALISVAENAGVGLRVVALARQANNLPASCSVLVEVGDSCVSIASTDLDARPTTVAAVGISQSTAATWARSLAPMVDPEHQAGQSNAQSAPVSLLALVDVATASDVERHWSSQESHTNAIAQVGCDVNGPVAIDLGVDGPHMLVAGTTGSGKSEFLRTLVMGLASSCSPQNLNLVLVDFKGGGAFDVCRQLPHVAGLITDLDEDLVGRAIASLRAELQRRERLFRDASVSSYERAVNALTEPLARLVVVIDEFAVLATDYPDLMQAIIDLAARGRSLGMHLVVATQRPSGVVDQKIRANTNIRVALRVQDAFDSHDVIGVADAASIDRRAPGRAIVRIGGDEPVTMQTAFSRAAFSGESPCVVTPFELWEPTRVGGEARQRAAAQEVSEIAVLLEMIETAAAKTSATARPLWVDPLPSELRWGDLHDPLVGVARGIVGPGFVVGLADAPATAERFPWRWVPDSGAVAVFGASAADCGRVVASFGCAASAALTADEMHLYLIDGDAGRLGSLAALPHVGAHIALAETDRISRCLGLFERELDERRNDPGARRAAIVLMIDNIAAVLGGFDDLASAAFVDRLAAVARDGTPLGVHVVLSARAVRDLPHRLALQVPQRLVLHLSDPMGYLALGVASADLVTLPAMRAIDIATGHAVQLVKPPCVEELGAAMDHRQGRGIVGVGAFPSHVELHDLPLARLERDTLRIPIGIDEATLVAAELALAPGDFGLVLSCPAGGRSSLLALIGSQLARCAVDAMVVWVAANQSSHDHGSGRQVITTRQGLRAATKSTARCVVLVDDAERVSQDMTDALLALTSDQTNTANVLVASTFEFARSLRSWVGPLRSRGTGVILGGTHFDGDLLHTGLTRLAGLGSIAGRGHVVVRGKSCAAQIGIVDERRF